MHIVMICPYYYPKVGGLENYVRYVSRELQKIPSIKVSVVTSSHDASLLEYEEIQGVSVHRMSQMIRLSNTPINLFWYWKLKKLFSQISPDVVNAHSPVPFIADVANLAARDMKIPFLLTYHAGSMKKGKLISDLLTGLYTSTLEKYLFNSSARVISLSEYVKVHTLKHLEDKVKLISPGITVNPSKNIAPRLTHKNRLMFVAKLDKSHDLKGLDILLSSVAEYIRKGNIVTLSVVGDGNHKWYYEKLARDLNIDNSVTFFGEVDTSNINHFYQECDVLVLPSLTNAESLGLVLVEAMSFGLPVIGTDVGGIPYLIRDGVNGFLAKPGDIKSLATAIAKIFSKKNDFKQMSSASLNESRKFDWDVHVENLVSIYSDVILSSN